MRSLRSALPLALATVLATTAVPLAAAAAPLAAGAVEIVRPAAGATLAAGGRAVVEWRPTGAAAPRFEEWEAFLSVDGGLTWPYRLTPHLDRARTRFEVELPPVPTPRALLLLRFGDEREERELAAPVELRIAAAHGALALDLPRLAAAAGESARPGAPGVIGWVEGRRDGRRAVRWSAAGAGLGAAAPVLAAALPAAAACPDDPLPHVAPGAAPGVTGPSTVSPASPLFPAPVRALGAAERLALLSRRNE
jgi:hypothetical protein